MAGLVGVYRIRENDVKIARLLPRMCEAVKHRDWHTTQTYEDDAIGLGRVSLGILNPETQPIYNEDRSLCIMMEGEVFDYQDVKKELESRGHVFTVGNDPEFVLHLYEERGEEFIHELNGSFLIVIYDFKGEKLLVANDRLGTRALYYCMHDGNLLFGSEVKAVLEDTGFERVVDDGAVLDFFTFGFILGEKTLLKGVKQLPYASILKCSGKGLSIKNYWNLEYREDYEDHPDGYYVDRLGELLVQAVGRQVDGRHRLVVGLSGGMDSRMFVGCSRKSRPGLRIPTVTFGSDKNCDDIRLAGKVAKKVGWPHHVILFASDYLADYGGKGVYLTDGMVGLTFFHAISILGELKKQGDIILLGTLMDVMFHFPYFDEVFTAPAKYEFNHRLFLETSIGLVSVEEELSELFDDSYYDTHKRLLEDSFKKIQERKPPKLAPNLFSYLLITQRMRRFIFEINNIVREEMEVRMPFLDNDLVDFYLTVPPRLIYNKFLITKTFESILPGLRKIPMQSTGVPIGAGKIEEKIYHLTDRLSKGIDLLVTKLSSGRMDRIRRRGYYAYDTWIREDERLREYFTDILLDERTLSRGYFKPEEIRRIVKLHLSGEKSYATKLGLLAAFELWHREFIDGHEKPGDL